jgi:hypothetical protein
VTARSTAWIVESFSPSETTTSPVALRRIVIVLPTTGTSSVCWSSLRGTSRVTCFIMIGIVTRKMIRSTSTTSTSGVTLISLRAVPDFWPVEIPMARS